MYMYTSKRCSADAVWLFCLFDRCKHARDRVSNKYWQSMVCVGSRLSIYFTFLIGKHAQKMICAHHFSNPRELEYRSGLSLTASPLNWGFAILILYTFKKDYCMMTLISN